MKFYLRWYRIAKPILKFFYRVKVVGAENEPDAPYIVYANHSSFIDPMLIAVSLRAPIRYAAKEQLFKIPVVGWFLRKLKVIMLKRDGRDMSGIREMLKALSDGQSIGIFPQGTRKPFIIPAKDDALVGFAAIATMSKATLLPATIVTSRLKPGIFRKTTIVIGQPITYQQYTGFKDDPSRREIADYCFESVVKPLEALK